MTDEIARLRELVKASGKDQLAFLNLLDRLETAERPDTCDCCGGSGKPVSGKPCICDGYGTAGWERVGLRKAVFDLEEKLEAAERRVGVLEGATHDLVDAASRILPRLHYLTFQGDAEDLAAALAALRGEEEVIHD
jgi:hypothetical protein